MNTLRSSPILLCLALLAPAVLAQEKVTFTPRFETDRPYTFDNSMETKMQMNMEIQGQRQQMDQTMNMLRKGTVTVLAVKDGVPSSIKVKFDNDCAQSMTMTGQQPQNMPFALAGKEVVVTKGELGILDIKGAEVTDDSVINELKEMMDPEPGAMFSDKAVGPGDEWEVKPDVMKKKFQVQEGDLQFKCKYVKNGEHAGMKVAELHATMFVRGKQQGMDMTMDLAGPVLVDLATHMPVSVQLSGKMGMDGQPQPGLTIKGGGGMQMRMTRTPQGAAAGGGGGFNIGGGNPLGAGGGGGGGVNPLGAGGPNWNGTFKDAELTVQLTAAAGGVTGSIKKGDATFPLKGKTEGTKLTGAFEAGGDSFDLSGTIDGNTLTFTTAGKTYTLKKAAVNPLGGDGGGGGPRNPLGQ